jgi:prephenate dehydrogenase
MSIAIIGLGLIGGSLLRRFGGEAIGYDADESTRAAAAEAGYAVADSVASAVSGRDVAIVAVPLPAYEAVVAEVRAAAPEILLTDVASVKGPVAGTPGPFVAGHPMAGTEESGFAAADPALFEDAAWVLCLEEGTAIEHWLAIARVVLGTGARVVPTTAAAHDAAVARISHLPHILAATLTQQAGDPLALSLAAGSFRDATRVAASRPELTTAMSQGNDAALQGAIEEQIRRLMSARRLLAQGRIGELFTAAHGVRSAWPVAAGEKRRIALSAADLSDQLLALGAAGGSITAIDDEYLDAIS